MKPQALAACAVLALAPIAVKAQGPASPPPPPQRSDPGFRALGLSPTQMKQVGELRRTMERRRRDLEVALRAKRRALEALYRSYDLDTAKVKQLNADMNVTQREILEIHLQVEQRLRQILTADQFRQLRDDMIRRIHMGRGGRPPGPTDQSPH